MQRVTIVTGGSRGIGAAACRMLAAEGHAVAVNYRSSADAAEAVAKAVTDAGGKAITVRADTAVEAEIVAMFDKVQAELGAITGLVNNAGVFGPRGRVDALQSSDIRDVLEINVLGYFLCAREAVKRMSTRHGGQGGSIVNISSGSSYRGNPGEGVLYAASKGAVTSLSIGLSQEVAGEGIRVNTVSPGLTVTDMPTQSRLESADKLPMGRAATVEEIGEAIVWLMSDKASYVAGANVRVGGGLP